jgi:hypothetical protein
MNHGVRHNHVHDGGVTLRPIYGLWCAVNQDVWCVLSMVCCQGHCDGYDPV